MGKKVFNGKQYEILNIIQEIEDYRDESQQVQFVFKEAILSLNRAFIFSNHIDSYLSGDIDEQDLFRLLFVDLGNLEEGI